MLNYQQKPGYTDGENSAEDTEPNDECAVLLNTQHSSIEHPNTHSRMFLRQNFKQGIYNFP